MAKRTRENAYPLDLTGKDKSQSAVLAVQSLRAIQASISTSALSLVGLFRWFTASAVRKAAVASIWAVWGAVLQIAQVAFARILQVLAAATIQDRTATVRAVYPDATPAQLPTYSSQPAQGRPTPIHTMTGDGRPSFGNYKLLYWYELWHDRKRRFYQRWSPGTRSSRWALYIVCWRQQTIDRRIGGYL